MISRIYLLSDDIEMCYEWKETIRNRNVTICHMRFDKFIKKHSDISCIVCPGNCDGYMDGGYDLAVADFFGKELIHKVRQYNKYKVSVAHYVGMFNGMGVIYTPTMEHIDICNSADPVTESTKSSIEVANELNFSSIVIPAFCAGTGNANKKDIALYMSKVINKLI